MERDIIDRLDAYIRTLPKNNTPKPNDLSPRADIIKRDDLNAARALFDNTTQEEVYEFLFGHSGCVENLAINIVRAFLPHLNTNYEVSANDNPYMALHTLFGSSTTSTEDDDTATEIVRLIVDYFPYSERYRKPAYLTKEELVRQAVNDQYLTKAALAFVLAFNLPSVVDRNINGEEHSYPLLTYALHIDNWELVELLIPYYDVTPVWLLCEACEDRLEYEREWYKVDNGSKKVVEELLSKYNYSLGELIDVLWFCQDNVNTTAKIARAIMTKRRAPLELSKPERK